MKSSQMNRYVLPWSRNGKMDHVSQTPRTVISADHYLNTRDELIAFLIVIHHGIRNWRSVNALIGMTYASSSGR